MNRGACLVIGIFFVGILFFGCGSDSKPEKAGTEKDRIEKVGDAASKLGYDGKAIEKQLRDVQGLKKEQNKELEKVGEE